jgi:hypothetical protein
MVGGARRHSQSAIRLPFRPQPRFNGLLFATPSLTVPTDVFLTRSGTTIEQEQHMYVQEFSVSKPIAVQQKPRKLTRIESMIRELSAEVAMLNSAIATEEKKSGVSDPNHFAYPCYAKAVMLRRNNLLRTIENLRGFALVQKLAA